MQNLLLALTFQDCHCVNFVRRGLCDTNSPLPAAYHSLNPAFDSSHVRATSNPVPKSCRPLFNQRYNPQFPPPMPSAWLFHGFAMLSRFSLGSPKKMSWNQNSSQAWVRLWAASGVLVVEAQHTCTAANAHGGDQYANKSLVSWYVVSLSMQQNFVAMIFLIDQFFFFSISFLNSIQTILALFLPSPASGAFPTPFLLAQADLAFPKSRTINDYLVQRLCVKPAAYCRPLNELQQRLPIN